MQSSQECRVVWEDTTRLVRVLIAEDESLVQAAVVGVLNRDPRIRVVGIVDSIEAVVAGLADTVPDVVLADLFLRDGTACDLGERLRRHPAAPRLVVTTYFAAGSAAAACRDVGASLCLDRRTLGHSLGDALVAVAAGRHWNGPGVVEPDRQASFSLAEAQVLAGVASGHSDAEIAGRLGYSQTYVKKILVAARNRLGARDRAHAAAMAAVLGFVRPVGEARFAAAVPSGSTRLGAHRRLLDGFELGDCTRRQGALLSKTGSR